MRNKIYPMRLEPEARAMLDRLGTRFYMKPPQLIMGVMKQIDEISKRAKAEGAYIPLGEVPRVRIEGLDGITSTPQPEARPAALAIIEALDKGASIKDRKVTIGVKDYLVSFSMREVEQADPRQVVLPIEVEPPSKCRECRVDIDRGDALSAPDMCGGCNRKSLVASVEAVIPEAPPVDTGAMIVECRGCSLGVYRRDMRWVQEIADKRCAVCVKKREEGKLTDRVVPIPAPAVEPPTIGEQVEEEAAKRATIRIKQTYASLGQLVEVERIEVKSQVKRGEWQLVGVAAIGEATRVRYDAKNKNKRLSIGQEPRFFRMPPESIDFLFLCEDISHWVF